MLEKLVDDVVICPNIKPIILHFRPGLDEIYFVPNGWIHIETYDLKAAKYAEQCLGRNEIAPERHAGRIPRGQTCTIFC